MAGERSLGSLVYWFRAKNEELKQKANESGKAIQDMSKKFDDSKKTIRSWSTDVKNSIRQVSDFAKQHKEAIQMVAVGTGAALAALTLEVKKATKENIEFTNAMIGLRSIAEGTGQNLEKTTKAAQDLAADGLMSVADAATGLKNLLLAGFGLDESIALMERFKDIAAFNRQAALGFGEAIRGATEGIKNGNSTLVDNIGLTKNLSIIMREAGYAETDVMRVTSDLNVRMAMFQGLMKETNPFIGDAAKLANELGGALSRTEESTKRLHRAIGSAVEGPIKNYLTILDNILNKTAQWIEDHQQLTSDIVLGLGGILAALLSLSTGLLLLDKMVKMLQLVRTLAMENTLAFAFRSWAGGAASATEAIGFLFGAFKPFLVGGAILAGLYLIVQRFREIQKEARLAATDIKTVNDLEKLRELSSFWKDEVKMLEDRRKALEESIKKREKGDTQGFQGPITFTGISAYAVTDDSLLKRDREALKNLEQMIDEAKRKRDEVDKKLNALLNPEKDPEGGRGGGGGGGSNVFNLDDFMAQLETELINIDKVATVFGDTSNVAKDKASALRKAIIELVENGVDPTNTAMGNLVERYKEYAQELEKTKEDTYDLFEAKTKLFKALEDIDQQAAVFGETLDTDRERLNLFRDAIVNALLNKEPIENIQDLIDEYNALKKKIDDATTAEQNNKEATDLLTQAQEYLYRMTGRQVPEWERFAQKLEEMAGKEGVLPETAAQLREIADQIRGAGMEEPETNWFTDVFEEIGYKIEEAQNIFKTFRDSLIDGFTDIITKGKDVGDVFKQILDYLAEMIVKKGIVEPIVDWVLSGIGLGSAHIGALVTPAGLVHDLSDYHSGGVIPGLRSDERVIKVLTGERILSREQNKKFEAGEYGKTEVTYEFNINAVDAASFVQLVRRHPEAITSVVAGDIAQDGQLRQIIKRYTK